MRPGRSTPAAMSAPRAGSSGSPRPPSARPGSTPWRPRTRVLPIDRRPVGTGPYRFVSEDADGIHLEAWPGYHGGLAATRYLDFVPDARRRCGPHGRQRRHRQLRQLPAGRRRPRPPGDRRRPRRPGGVAAASRTSSPSSSTSGPGACSRTSTSAGPSSCASTYRASSMPRPAEPGPPIYGPVMAGSWAYDPTVPKPARDSAAARELIEDARLAGGAPTASTRRTGSASPPGSWSAATIRHGSRWPTSSPTRRATAGWSSAASRWSWGDIVSGLLQYPHDIPGTKTPFDLCLGGWLDGTGDPAVPFSSFVSSAITDAAHPDGTSRQTPTGSGSRTRPRPPRRGRRRRPTTRPSGRGSTGRRSRSSRPSCRTSSCGPRTPPTSCAPRSRPSTDHSTSPCRTGPGSRSGWWWTEGEQ